MGLYVHTNTHKKCMLSLKWVHLTEVMFYCQFHYEDLSFITLVYHFGVAAIIALT
jgi:hypothetical protein